MICELPTGDHVGCGEEGNLLCRVCMTPLPGHLSYYPERNATLVHPSCVGYRVHSGLAGERSPGPSFLTESTTVPLVLADLYIPPKHRVIDCVLCDESIRSNPVLIPGVNICEPHQNEMVPAGHTSDCQRAAEIEYMAAVAATNPVTPSPVNPVDGAGTEDEPMEAALWRAVFWRHLAERLNTTGLMLLHNRRDHFIVATEKIGLELAALAIGSSDERLHSLSVRMSVIVTQMRASLGEMIRFRCSVTPCRTVVCVSINSGAMPHDERSLRAACEMAMVDPDRPLCDMHRRVETPS